jgi:site-specific DNA-methyltransferase (adenine-specific)
MVLICGDSLHELKKFEDNSVDLIVTDPPYGYSFMGKEWDKALPDKKIWKECLRVLKDGGFAYVMSSPRQDVLSRMMKDLEDVGFNTAFTSMYWAYASGFPKGLNVSKAVDKRLGVEREITGTRISAYGDTEESESNDGRNLWAKPSTKEVELKNKPASEQAKKLDGSYAGFQPKPAVEVIIVCMKPLSEKGYIDQAMENGKGVSWFDDCRIPSKNNEHHRDLVKVANTGNDIVFGDAGLRKEFQPTNSDKGRYPANLLVSDNAVDTGNITKSPSGVAKRNPRNSAVFTGENCGFKSENLTESGKGDSGDFSRYFDIDKWWESQFIITPKASKSEKNKGLDDGFESKFTPTMGKGIGEWHEHDPENKAIYVKNNHPTVKPLKLMSYLITLGSREGDIVLDPFMGSGTTPLASKNLKREYIGIERDPEYFKICEARVASGDIEKDKKSDIKTLDDYFK